jgi:hypothetical protein
VKKISILGIVMILLIGYIAVAQENNDNGDLAVEITASVLDIEIITITIGGNYHFDEILYNRQTNNKINGRDTVNLTFDGVNIGEDLDSEIYSNQNERLIITIPDHVANVLTEAIVNNFIDHTWKESDVVIFIRGSLVIRRYGSFTITSNYHNGIETRDTLIIENDGFTNTIFNHRIKNRNFITIRDGIFSINAQNDRIQVEMALMSQKNAA